jgi:tetratricopeptide (TPR) repeat protein
VAWTAANAFLTNKAFEAAERAVAYARRADDRQTLANALEYLSFAAARLRRFHEARAAIDEAATFSTPNPTPAQQARRLELRGIILLLSGDHAAAAASLEEQRRILVSLGDEHGAANATQMLAELEHARGRTQRAVELSRELMPRASRLMGREQHANLLNNLAGYLLALDDGPGARGSAAESLALMANADPGSAFVTMCLEHLALALALEGDWPRAARLYGYCDTRLAALGYEREHTERVTHERLTALLLERYDAAELAAIRLASSELSGQSAVADALATSSV